jgi:hypothetical protein
MSDYIPTSDAEFSAWLQNFISVLSSGNLGHLWFWWFGWTSGLAPRTRRQCIDTTRSS